MTFPDVDSDSRTYTTQTKNEPVRRHTWDWPTVAAFYGLLVFLGFIVWVVFG